MKKIFWTISCVLLVAATLCACSSNKFPTGKYRNGSSVTEYRDDGTFTMWDSDEIVTEGTYSVKGDEVTWIQDTWCDAVNAGSATYKWIADDQGLKFEKIGEEKCNGRWAALSIKWFGPIE
jgi:hypothetical protein